VVPANFVAGRVIVSSVTGKRGGRENQDTGGEGVGRFLKAGLFRAKSQAKTRDKGGGASYGLDCSSLKKKDRESNWGYFVP